MAPNYGMKAIPTMATGHLDERMRQSLRLDSKLWAAIDIARQSRSGTISRNTWITEAIEEKVAREKLIQNNPNAEDVRRA